MRRRRKGMLRKKTLLLLCLTLIVALLAAIIIFGLLNSKRSASGDTEEEYLYEEERGGETVEDDYEDFRQYQVDEDYTSSVNEELDHDDGPGLDNNSDQGTSNNAEEDTWDTDIGEQYSNGEEDKKLDIIREGDSLLALVTKETKLKSDYVPSNLVPIPSHMNPSYDMYLRSEALDYLGKLYEAAEEDGITLSIRSAYRSYSTQKWLFNDYANRYGEEEANRFSARPGQSEHQLGTTVDFGGTSVDFTAAFGETERGKWLAENAYKYGFALSYPQNKEHITGYIYEPWHFRYIGIAAAREWKESGLTLREYLEGKPQEFE